MPPNIGENDFSSFISSYPIDLVPSPLHWEKECALMWRIQPDFLYPIFFLNWFKKLPAHLRFVCSLIFTGLGGQKLILNKLYTLALSTSFKQVILCCIVPERKL